MSPNLSRAREVGINSYVVKPVKRLDLFRAIASAVGNKTAETQSASRSAPAVSPPGENRRLRILLAEDSPDNRLLIEAYLKKLPYQLDTAENGQVAVEKFVRQHYDLVLMDVRMPVMDGYTAVRIIRDWERARGRQFHADSRAHGFSAGRRHPKQSRSRMHYSCRQTGPKVTAARDHPRADRSLNL